jgi:hypothetical protein
MKIVWRQPVAVVDQQGAPRYSIVLVQFSFKLKQNAQQRLTAREGLIHSLG